MCDHLASLFDNLIIERDGFSIGKCDFMLWIMMMWRLVEMCDDVMWLMGVVYFGWSVVGEYVVGMVDLLIG
jgi:hypothetical protein